MPCFRTELDLDRAVLPDRTMMQLEPAVVVVVPLIRDAVANNRVLSVAQAIGLILAMCFPFRLVLLTAVFDVRSYGRILWITCDTKLTA